EKNARLLAGDELDSRLGSEALERLRVARADAGARCSERNGAVHGAGVDVREVQGAGDQLAGRGLADAGGAVDSDDHRCLAATRGLAGVFFADGFLRDTGLAAGRFFGAFGSFMVASMRTSRSLSSRHTPGVSFGSEMGPMATRRSFDTGCPTAWNILRICCVRPSRSFTSNQLLPSSSPLPVVLMRSMSQGRVRFPSSVMPRRSFSTSRSSGTPRTFTWY